MKTASTLSRQLRFNVHPADGALLIGDEPLVHTQLVEEVHTGESSGEEQTSHYHTSHVGTVTHTSTFLCCCLYLLAFISKDNFSPFC